MVEEVKYWYTPQELAQVFSRHKTFTHTTSGDTAEDAASVLGAMVEGHRVSFVVDLNDLYVEFDDDASSSAMLVPAGTGYSEGGIYIGSRISIINAVAGSNGRIRGIIWGR